MQLVIKLHVCFATPKFTAMLATQETSTGSILSQINPVNGLSYRTH
jgi:hypothetical protein